LNELLALRKVLDRYAFTTLWPHRDAAYRAEFTVRNCAIVQAMETGKRTAAIKAKMHFQAFRTSSAATARCWRSGSSSRRASSSASR
jgi:hypothetical protein